MNLDPKFFPPNDIANPCGLLSKYFPRDEYLYLQNVETKKQIPITLQNVKDPFFSKNFKRSTTQKQWTDVEDARFINWMKSSSRKQFRKLWGFVDQDIPQGEYQIFIKNGQNFEQMNCNKFFVIVNSFYFTQKNYWYPFWLFFIGAGLILMTILIDTEIKEKYEEISINQFFIFIIEMKKIDLKKIQENTMKAIYYGWIPLIIALGFRSAKGDISM